MSHVVFFVGNFFSGSQGHVDTQNWVTYVTRKPIVHRDTGSRWSRGSRGVFFGKILFLGHRVTWITLWVIGKFCFWYTWSRWSRWSQCFFKTFFLGHRVTLVTLCFFENFFSSRSQGHVGHVIFFCWKILFLGHRVTWIHKIGSHM